MRWASSALLAATACNQVFGNTAVSGRDAAFFDAKPDAVTTCEGVPAFSRSFVQAISQNCTSYTLSAIGGQAAGLCLESSNSRTIEVGPRDEMLASDPAIAAMLSETNGGVRMAADGQRISFALNDGTQSHVVIFARTGNSWAREPDVLVVTGLLHSVSEITLSNRMLVAYGGTDVRELVLEGETWVEVARDRLNPAPLYGVHLSADGLRSWGKGSGGIALYTRPDVDSPFVLAGTMPGTNGFDDGYLTEDCGAVYFPALGSIWIAPRG